MVMADFCVVTAFFDNNNQFRERNLLSVVDYYVHYLSECEIVIAEQYPSGFAEKVASSYPDRVKLVGMDSMRHDPDRKGIFCKSELLNEAIRSSDCAYCVMGDADALLTEKCFASLREAKSALDSGRASIVYPFDDVIYMNEADTRRILEEKPMLPGEKDHGVDIFRQTGLCNVFTRDTWERVGGFDEDFVGWGAEDDAFLCKCRRIVGPPLRLDGTIYHMFHPKVDTESYRKSAGYIANRKRCACIRRMSDDDLSRYCRGEASLESLVTKYADADRLEVELKWQCSPSLTLEIDTTIYDVDRSGKMSFTKLLDAVAAEDGRENVPKWVREYIGIVPGESGPFLDGLLPEQVREIEEYVSRCSS
jgi:hypothetical protein